MTTTTPALFLDFDGTVTARDAIDAILERFADSAWQRVEEDWVAGRIGSRECLRAQIALVRASRQEVDALLDTIAVDPGFAPLLRSCAAHEVPVAIVSDGFDYCIRRILTRPSLGLESLIGTVQVVSSHLELVDGRWHAGFTAPPEGCVHGCATCKPAAIARLNDAGRQVVFAGDGLSDRYAAAAADVVFAKAGLAKYCSNQSIPYISYNSLTSIALHFDTLLGPGASAAGAFPERALPTT